jgi:hypothetical protein
MTNPKYSSEIRARKPPDFQRLWTLVMHEAQKVLSFAVASELFVVFTEDRGYGHTDGQSSIVTPKAKLRVHHHPVPTGITTCAEIRVTHDTYELSSPRTNTLYRTVSGRQKYDANDTQGAGHLRQ